MIDFCLSQTTDYAFDKGFHPLFGYRQFKTIGMHFLVKQSKHIANITYLFYNTLVILLSESKNMARGISKCTLATLVVTVYMCVIGC